MITGVGLEPNHVWAPCCETWLKFEIGITVRKRNVLRITKKSFWVWVTLLVGRHVVNDSGIASNVGCHVVNKLV
jgi:hypothetical protein